MRNPNYRLTFLKDDFGRSVRAASPEAVGGPLLHSVKDPVSWIQQTPTRCGSTEDGTSDCLGSIRFQESLRGI